MVKNSNCIESIPHLLDDDRLVWRMVWRLYTSYSWVEIWLASSRKMDRHFHSGFAAVRLEKGIKEINWWELRLKVILKEKQTKYIYDESSLMTHKLGEQMTHKCEQLPIEFTLLIDADFRIRVSIFLLNLASNCAR